MNDIDVSRSTETSAIIRDSIDYWIWGDGYWHNRWHCTSGDIWLATIQIVLTSLMFGMYLKYSYRSHKALQYVVESNFVKHLVRLRNVFLVCGSIHVMNGVLCWWIPVYWLSNLTTALNCIQCYYLLKYNREVLSIQEHTHGVVAIHTVSDARDYLQRQKQNNLQEVQEHLDRLEQILGNHGTR